MLRTIAGIAFADRPTVGLPSAVTRELPGLGELR